LPGNKIAKALQVIAIVALMSLLMFLVVFPWLENFMTAPPVVGEN